MFSINEARRLECIPVLTITLTPTGLPEGCMREPCLDSVVIRRSLGRMLHISHIAAARAQQILSIVSGDGCQVYSTGSIIALQKYKKSTT